MEQVSESHPEDVAIMEEHEGDARRLQSKAVKKLVFGGPSTQPVTLEQLRARLATDEDPVLRSIATTLTIGSSSSVRDWMYILHRPRGQFKAYDLSRMKPEFSEPIGAETVNSLKRLKPPMYLFRAVTCEGRRHTNGHTTERHFIPSAAVDGRTCREQLRDVPRGELAAMIGTHLAWDDRIQDELLSWTDSLLFALVHLYLRHLKGQGVAYLACIDRRKAYQVDQKTGERRQVAEFFWALTLAHAVMMHSHECFQSPVKSNALVSHKFTHEYLTHGIIEYSEDQQLQMVSWESLVDKGLFKLLPEVCIPLDMKATGLSEVLHYLRRLNYGKAPCMTTQDELDTAERLALLHSPNHQLASQATDGNQHFRRPHLTVLMSYLSLRERSSDDKLLQSRIRALGYQRPDLDDLLHDGYGKIPDNLPEKLAYFRLLHNVQIVVGGASLPQEVLVHRDVGTGHKFLAAERDSKPPNLYYDPYRQSTKRKNGTGEVNYEDCGLRCGSSCDCIIWESTSKTLRQLRCERRSRRSLDRRRNKDCDGDETDTTSNDDEKGVDMDDNDWYDDNSRDAVGSAKQEGASMEQELYELGQESKEYVEKECAAIKEELEGLDKRHACYVTENVDRTHRNHGMGENDVENALGEDTKRIAHGNHTGQYEHRPPGNKEDSMNLATLRLEVDYTNNPLPPDYEKIVIMRRRRSRIDCWESDHDFVDGDADKDNDDRHDDNKDHSDGHFHRKCLKTSREAELYVQFLKGIFEWGRNYIYFGTISPESRKISLKRKLKDLTSFPPHSKARKLEAGTPSPSRSNRGKPSHDLSSEPLSKPPKILRTKTDFIISLKPKYLDEILCGTKTYEFRRYPLHASNMWIYESAPISAVRYFCVISPPKKPGQLDEKDLDIERNRMFQHGQNESGVTHAHKILEVWKLEGEGMTLEEMMEEGIPRGPPRRNTFLAASAVERLRQGMVKISIG